MRPGASQPGKSSSDPDRAQRTRSSARKVQLSLKTGSPSLRRAWQAYNHALEEVSKEENSRPVKNNKLLLGVPAAPLSFNFFWSFNGYIPYLTSRQQDGCAGIVVRRGVRCGARRGDAPPNTPEPVCGNQKGRRRLVRWLILCHCRSLCRQATVNVKRVAAGCIVIV